MRRGRAASDAQRATGDGTPATSRGQRATGSGQRTVAIVGPVFPYRAGIAYCTTRLAEELQADVISFKRQFPKRFYPGGNDIDPTLPCADARFLLDILNPLTWIRGGLALRQYDSVILVWWVWVWALPYLTMLAFLRKRTRVILQCHNIGDKEPAAWKRMLSNLVLRRGDVLVVHAKSEAEDARRRLGIPSPEPSALPSPASGRGRAEDRPLPRAGEGRREASGEGMPRFMGTPRVITTSLPVHELGGKSPSRDDARKALNIEARNVALFFGHVRPFKGLDIALEAWQQIHTDALLLVAGEAWWKAEDEYRRLATAKPRNPAAFVRFEFRFIPDAEIAMYFAACDVVLAPYRIEAQSGVALTSFHFARPVIATTVGGLPEIIEEGSNGMLVPPEDAVALANAVDAFFAREDRGAMESNALRSAGRYSWAEYGGVFRDLVG